jgi:hypothetical protein
MNVPVAPSIDGETGSGMTPKKSPSGGGIGGMGAGAFPGVDDETPIAINLAFL